MERLLLRFADYVLDGDNEQLLINHQPLRLTNKAFAVLRYLVVHAGQLVSKDALLTVVWPETVVSETTLTNCIGELRRALGDDAKQPRFIETVHRRGYRFIAPLSTTLHQELGVRGQGSVEKVQNEGQRASDHAVLLPAPNPRPPAPVLVGREAELTQLHHLFAKALKGERQLVFVTGEAGIGKTTLVEAFVQSLTNRDYRPEDSQLGAGNAAHGAKGNSSSALRSLLPAPSFAWGQCIEQYGAGETYLPVLEAIGRLGRGPQKKRVLTVLQQYAPTWLVQLPALLSAQELEVVQRRIQGATRERMLREIVDALDVLSAEQPLVLVLEDLHWSDPSTVEFLTALARRREAAHLFVVGTYRAVELAVGNHPLKTVKHELVARRYATEIALSFLSPAAVWEYVGQRLPDADTVEHLAQVIYQRTDGQPLFMVQMTEYLLQQCGPTGLAAGEAYARYMPQELREVIEAQLSRLTGEEQQVLAVGSVVGAEFTASSVAAGMASAEAGIEETCVRLVRRGQFIEERGIRAWPDGTVSGNYGFRHALYQEVLYARIPQARRGRWHNSIGEWQAHAFGERAHEIAAELAVHFEHGRDFPRAIQYRYAAAQRALGQHAAREALAHLTHGLTLLPHVPAGSLHTQWELMLQTTYGVTLATTQGYADPIVAQAHLRAHELSHEMTDPARLFPILCGLWGFFIVRSDLSRALALAEHLVALVEQSPQTTSPALAYGIHGQTSILSGQLPAARTSFEQSLRHYAADQHGQLLAQYNEDPGIISHTLYAQTLWLLGYADHARQQLAEGEGLARELAHPYSLAQHLWNAMILWQWSGELSRIGPCYEELHRLCHDEAFPVWRAGGMIVQGWTLVHRHQDEAGVSLIQQGLQTWQAIGIRLILPYYQTLLAEAYVSLGQPEQGEQILEEVFAHLHTTQERFYEAEVWRRKGQLTLQKGARRWELGSSPLLCSSPNPKSQIPAPAFEAEAEECFLKAIKVARTQQAKSLELRAVMSLVRLRQQQLMQYATRNTQHVTRVALAEAHRMLSDVYHWFTEGFDTKDLQEAKVLLAELSHEESRPLGD